MRAPRSLLFLAAAAAVLAPPLRAQAPTAAPGFSCAATTDSVLGFLSGRFDVEAVFRTGPGAWDSTHAVVTITPDLGGCVLSEHFQGTRYGAPYEYRALWSAHGGGATPIQRAFVHSQHGVLGLAAGQVIGDTLVLDDSAFVRQRWIHQRLVLWREGGGGGNLRSEGRRSEDGRASWYLTQRSRYVRRPEGARGPARVP